MRDYSFGNFISALRERRGLSQYQLGALVGKSDKAVSKWENGASKPRIDTIRKLSEVLDISVDELLTCEYAAFDKKRKDLFTMKNEIIDIAKNKMKEMYGDNPPIRIVNRFKTEELMLDGQETLLWMGFFGKLQEEFCAKDLYFEIRGAQMGASFIAWLLGGTNVNPLPSHYFCPTCKKVEFVSDEKCGMDLPEKKCSCGINYRKDGFGISEINMYPIENYNEIYISGNATGCVKDCLQEYFEGYGVVRELNVIFNENMHVENEEQIKITRFVLFPKDMDKKYPEGLINIQADEYYKSLSDWSVLMTIEDVNEQISSRDLMNLELSTQQVNAFFSYAVENDKFKVNYREVNLDKALSDNENPKFSTLLTLYGFLHGTGAWEDNAELLYDKGIPLGELISSREDVYAYLYDKLNGKCCENPSGVAFEIKEAVRKGKYTRSRMPAETEQLLKECDVPDWYVESMKKILYLFPKTYLIVLLKRDIYKFMVLDS